MAHIPVNHPLAPVFRVLAGAAGAYVLAFGVIGAMTTWGRPIFERDGTVVLGLHTNLAFSLLSTVVGAVVLGGVIIGGNLAHWINMIGGGVFLLAGLAMLALMQTDANLLNFSVATCVVSYGIGLAMLLSGLYDKVGPPEAAEAEHRFRCMAGEDPVSHRWRTDGRYPKRPTPDGGGDGHRFA
jgi:hypothetical protein